MLPQVRPVITAVTLLLVIWALNAITIIYAITRGGPANRTLITPIQIFRLAFESVQFNQAAALSVMFFAVAIVIVFVYIKALRQSAGRQPMSASAAVPGSLKRPGLGRPVIFVGSVATRPGLPFPVSVDGALLDQDAARTLHRAAALVAGSPDAGELLQGALRKSTSRATSSIRVIISVGSTGLALVLAVFASYGFARFRFKGRSFWQAFVLVGQLLPTAAIIVPLFITLRVLGLVNTYWGLILVYMIITLPLSVWMLTSYFRAIPRRARGGRDHRRRRAASASCSASRCRCRCPASWRCCVYAFVTTWNEFIFALCFATDSSVKTLPIGLAEFSTEFNTDWGAVMAASMVMTVPIALLFLVFQKLFVGGLTAGATKG